MTPAPRSRSRLWYLPLALLLFTGAKGKGCGCKPPPDDDVVDVSDDVGAKPDVALQVTAVEPAKAEARKRFDARVFGAGFEPGAIVHFGGLMGMDATVSDGNTIRVTAPDLDPGTYDVHVTNPSGTRATLRRGLVVESTLPDCSFLRVYFEFDKAKLVDDAAVAIDKFMPCYGATSSTLLVEGHTDERGTTEYNLALGQRRADTVVRHLTSRGVSGARIQAVSYGEERPIEKGHDEVAWSKNRRADIYVGR